MSGDKKPLISWDSCLFLAWFNQEQDKPLAWLDATLRRIRNGDLLLLVSAICISEVLDLADTTAGSDFRAYVRRDNVIRANVDFRVAEIAARYREAAKEALDRGDIQKGVKAPDALIVATASLYKADVLYTFDPVLLGLSLDPIVNGMRIERPPSSPLPIETGGPYLA